MSKKRVLVGMSGGVDSSVAALLLLRQGYEVIGVTMKLFGKLFEKSFTADNAPADGCCGASEAAQGAKRVCEALGIPHYTLDMQEIFRCRVIENFISAYRECQTPNPCVECNRWLKFGAMWQRAAELGCEYIATGHYARIAPVPGYEGLTLQRGRAAAKDQSYFLYGIPRELLPHVLFPLGDFAEKEEIRSLARQNRLPVAEAPESQDICFISGSYRDFLAAAGIEGRPGEIVNSQGEVIGRHRGLHNYTIGQRRGLGIAAAQPLYVLGYKTAENRLIVGTEAELYRQEMEVGEINLLTGKSLDEHMDIEIKIRYGSPPVPARLLPCEDGERLRVGFRKAQKAITPGQAAVFYAGNIVLGGGKII